MMRLREGCCINESACSVGALTSLVVPTQPSQPRADPEYSTARQYSTGSRVGVIEIKEAGAL